MKNEEVLLSKDLDNSHLTIYTEEKDKLTYEPCGFYKINKCANCRVYEYYVVFISIWDAVLFTLETSNWRKENSRKSPYYFIYDIFPLL